MRITAALLLSALAACTPAADQPTYGDGDLPFLVLQEAPKGTVPAEDPGHKSLDQVAGDDQTRRTILEKAGFADMYEATFIGTETGPNLEGFLLTSRAYLFKDPDAGVEALQELVESKGTSQSFTVSPIAGRKGFTVAGKLDDGIPSGTLMVWTKGNVVMAIAAVASGTIDDAYLRRIAVEVDTLEPVTYP